MATLEQVAEAREIAQEARKARWQIEETLTKQNAALKGMRTMRDRGFKVSDEKMAAQEAKVAGIERDRDAQVAAVEIAEETVRKLQDENARAAWAKIEEWGKAIQAAYPNLQIRYHQAGVEIGDESFGFRTGLVSVYFPRLSYRGEIEPAGVNWSALGTQKPETVKRFMTLMQAGLAIAEQADADHLENVGQA